MPRDESPGPGHRRVGSGSWRREIGQNANLAFKCTGVRLLPPTTSQSCCFESRLLQFGWVPGCARDPDWTRKHETNSVNVLVGGGLNPQDLVS